MAQDDPENKVRTQSSDGKLASGDEAMPETPGTGEDVCPQCEGKGRTNGVPCPNCGGRGTVIRGIGGA